MGMHRIPILVLTVVALVTGACGDDGTGSPRQPQSSTTTTEGSSKSTTTTPSEPEAVIGEVRMTVTGGVAGVEETVVVMPDGSVLVGDRDSEPSTTGRTLAAEQLAALHDAVGSEEFAELAGTYVPEGYCCDQFVYEITAEIDDTTISSATADGIEAPAVLEEALTQLRTALSDQ
jgi:hypothetical protein